MIFKTGNILKEVKSGIIVHSVNNQGVMGAGLALQIKKKYPKCFDLYVQELNATSLGTTSYYNAAPSLWIANCVTQEYYGHRPNVCYANYKALEKCFNEVFDFAAADDLDVHMPDMISCGLAGADRETVLQLIMKCKAGNPFVSDITFWKLK